MFLFRTHRAYRCKYFIVNLRSWKETLKSFFHYCTTFVRYVCLCVRMYVCMYVNSVDQPQKVWLCLMIVCHDRPSLFLSSSRCMYVCMYVTYIGVWKDPPSTSRNDDIQSNHETNTILYHIRIIISISIRASIIIVIILRRFAHESNMALCSHYNL